MRAAPGVTRFFEEERDKLAASLKKSEHTLATFRSKTALASAATQVDAYSRRLAEAEHDATDAQYDLKESEQRAAILKEELDREPERVPFSSTIRYNPMIQAMQERLLTLEMEEEQLLTLYTDTDRRVQDKRTEIEAQKQALAEARARGLVPQTEMTALNDRHRDLEVQYIAATLAIQKNAIRAESARTIAAEMHEPFLRCELAEETGMLPLQPDMPGSGHKEKNQDPIPAQKFAKPETRFPVKTGKQTEDCGGIKQAVQAFRHAGERDENPKTHKPAAPPLPSSETRIDFIKRYGREMFHARFLAMANLRGILLRGGLSARGDGRRRHVGCRIGLGLEVLRVERRRDAVHDLGDQVVAVLAARRGSSASGSRCGGCRLRNGMTEREQLDPVLVF
jgi:hypothetical protein